MEWAQTQLHPDFNKLFWLTVRTPPADYDNAPIRDTYARVISYYEKLEAQLSGRDYVAGQQLTMADFPTGATLCRYSELPIERPERPELPNVAAWYRRLSERDAHRRHVMVSFEERGVGWRIELVAAARGRRVAFHVTGILRNPTVFALVL